MAVYYFIAPFVWLKTMFHKKEFRDLVLSPYESTLGIRMYMMQTYACGKPIYSNPKMHILIRFLFFSNSYKIHFFPI